VVLVALTLPLLVPALRALWEAGPAYITAGIAVGAGASAAATILFTQAFIHGDVVTIVVLQKAQPLVAVFGAWLLLHEQPRPRFAWFLLPALAGIWLIALPHPFDPHARGLTPIVETLSAATLWGMGTVLGRFLTRRIAFEHVTTVRFAFGLVASACALPIVGASAYSTASGSRCSRSSPGSWRSVSTTTGCGGLQHSSPPSASSRSRSRRRSSASTSSEAT
jgi:drug/metabolite transporter (DMT)-like permease